MHSFTRLATTCERVRKNSVIVKISKLNAIIFLGAVDVVKLLLKYGADPQATCSEGRTPFDQAKTSPEIRKLLHKANRNVDSSLAKRSASCANCGL